MSMMSRDTSETSVTFSLAELAKLEAERVREEEVGRARAREKEARSLREADAQKRAAEAQRLAAEAEASARRAREEAIEKARAEARERAAADVARIEAEARGRLEADNARRAHELALMRVQTEGSARKLKAVLAVVIGVAILGGGGAAVSVSQKVTALEHETAELREGQTALAHEREHAKANELAALSLRHAALRARAGAALAKAGTLGVGRDVDEALRGAETARSAVDTRALDHDRLRAFGDAVDTLGTRLETLERVAALDRRRADLDAWAADRAKLDDRAVAKAALVKAAATRARATGAGGDAADTYEVALAELHSALARSGKPGPGSVPGSAGTDNKGTTCIDKNDPMCGLNGHTL